MFVCHHIQHIHKFCCYDGKSAFDGNVTVDTVDGNVTVDTIDGNVAIDAIDSNEAVDAIDTKGAIDAIYVADIQHTSLFLWE